VTEQLGRHKAKFESAMDDDLNTAVALSVVFELVRLGNDLMEKDSTTVGTLQAVNEVFAKLGGGVLGIVIDGREKSQGIDESMVDKLVSFVIEQRNEARRAKDYAKADKIRAGLDEMGIVLEDKSGATQWRWK
jgi:cysteinyl-tRNA synthetase